MANIAIIGSRSFSEYGKASIVITKAISKLSDVVIVSGGASGADYMGKLYAQKNNLEYIEFPAKWNDLTVENCVIKRNKFGIEYNALAGHNRNKDIINKADYVIAFWDMKSPGTKNSIDLCRASNKPIIIVDIRHI